MNRRQRKKHRIREFQELGFELRFRTPARWSDDEQNAFCTEAIRQIEALGLAIGGGTDVQWDVFVSGLATRATVTPAQRQALLDWLAQHPDVTDVEAGPLEDAWQVLPG